VCYIVSEFIIFDFSFFGTQYLLLQRKLHYKQISRFEVLVVVIMKCTGF